MVKPAIGVLALQGAFQKHIDILSHLGHTAIAVRDRDSLNRCRALIIPGGESTTMTRLMRAYQLTDELKAFCKYHPVMGTCAGLILMSSHVDDDRVDTLNVMEFTALRNVYGRQRESFVAQVDCQASLHNAEFEAIFIRAPGIQDLHADIEVLARYNHQPVLIAQGAHMAMAFHPELTNNNLIHQYWLSRF